MADKNLQFPSSPDKGDRHEHNGVVYYWDTVSNSWVLLSSASVNKNYVDSRDQLRFRRDGNDFMHGDIRIKIENDEVSQTTLRLKTDGTIISSGQSRLHFSSVGAADDYGKISYGEENNPVEMMSFSASFIDAYKTIRIDADNVNSRLFLVENPGLEEVVLFDVQQIGPSDAVAAASILLSDSRNSYFAVKTDTSADNVSINAEAKLKVTSSVKEAFVVTNQNSTEDPPFRVDADTHKIFASKEYSDALNGRGGAGVITGPGGNTQHEYKEENVLVTKAYVDASVGSDVGRKVCADKEEDAEIGGFWYDGRGLFLKVG